jgi:hypothetical protein
MNTRVTKYDTNQLEHITVRPTVPDDAVELATLAQLDSAPIPDSPGLVAESGGRIVAYMSSRGDEIVADPFVRTANLLALLRLRSVQGATDIAKRRVFSPRLATFDASPRRAAALQRRTA